MFERLRRLIDSPLGAMLGGAGYGGWAWFANLSAGAGHALRIGFTHFSMSTGLTLAGVAMMNRLFRLGSGPRRGAAFAFCGSMVLTYSLLISVHWAIGTPHIALTLAPGLLPTTAFCVLYSLLLLRQARSGPTLVAPTVVEPEPIRDEVPTVLR